MPIIRMRSRALAMGVLASALALLVSGCSSGTKANASPDTSPTTTASAAASATVAVTLGDGNDSMFMDLDPASVPAGTVTFEVTNTGEREHEFVVLRTDLAAADLPFDAEADEAIEDGDGVTPVDEIEEIAQGETKTLTVDLTEGHYALICNIERHYRLGMRADFDVQ